MVMIGALANKTVVLAVTGGIAAYKSAELVRLLIKAGARVRVIMSRAACEFITPLTMRTLSGHDVAIDLFAPVAGDGIGHIELATLADILVVAPATANVIARMAAGMADDLVTAVLLATRAPILLAPAMNTHMWENTLTQENLARLAKVPRVRLAGPQAGDLACGWVGTGRMSEPEEIVTAAEAWLSDTPAPVLLPGTLANKHVVVTAGPTWEAVDDVRFLGNRSSGKMGFAMAACAAELGAQVTLIAGPVALPTPPRVNARVDVESALEMREALHRVVTSADVVVMAAAVADFRPGIRVLGKLSRRDEKKTSRKTSRTIPLVPNPDLLAELGHSRALGGPFLVGFAAEVGTTQSSLIARAERKLREKGCDMVVANEVGSSSIGFGSDLNAVTLVFADGRVVDLPAARKEIIAQGVWDCIITGIKSPHIPSSSVSEQKRIKKGTRKNTHA